MRKLVVISAGLRTPSSTRMLADRLATATAGRLEVETTVVELREVAHEITDHLLTGFAPAKLQTVLDAVAAADGLILVTPIFQASYSGLFKSFADLIGKGAVDGKPVLLAATGGSIRHSLAVDHALRPLFAHLRAVPVPTGVFAATEDWGNDSSLRTRIDQAAGELAAEMDRRDPAVVTDPFLLTTSFDDLLRG
ncbi:FMN reductase [Actinoplanes sp. NPDC049265]|uniref:FMN reductase n=1 Tax=Actinoplanes sp. NPDC049265 TaxID=3363902 RepID=UPI003715FB5B